MDLISDIANFISNIIRIKHLKMKMEKVEIYES